MVNYSNSKIYKVEPIVPHPPEDIYYGATTKKYLCQRWGGHKGDYNRKKKHITKTKILFDKYGIDKCHIVLIEAFPCQSKDELLARESYFIRNNPCVNKMIPDRTKEEYRQFYMSVPENREHKTALQSQRRNNATDEEKEQRRIRHNEQQKIRRNRLKY